MRILSIGGVASEGSATNGANQSILFIEANYKIKSSALHFFSFNCGAVCNVVFSMKESSSLLLKHCKVV